MSSEREARAKESRENLRGLARRFATTPSWTPIEPIACSRCGLLVWSKSSFAGKCLETGCANVLCWSCWNLERRRFCLNHAKKGSELEYESKQPQ